MNETANKAAIFESVGQALHVSFLIMANEAQQEAPLRKALMRMLESLDLSEGQNDWLQQLRGEKIGTVNFGGLSSNEVRAQCALVVSAVASKLPDPEKWCIQAKFGQMASLSSDATDRQREAARYVQLMRDKLEGMNGFIDERTTYLVGLGADDAERVLIQKAIEEAIRRAQDYSDKLQKAEVGLASVGAPARLPMSMQRIIAIQGLSTWLAPSYSSIAPMAIDCLLAKVFCNHDGSKISVRDLEASFGTSKSTFQRAYDSIKKTAKTLELQACARLEPYFVEQGIVEAE